MEIINKNCPICNSSLLKHLKGYSIILYTCTNKKCKYRREIDPEKKAYQKLITTVPCYVNDKKISDSFVVSVSDQGAQFGKITLTISADKNDMYGKWDWYLEDLLHLGKYSKDQLISDQLYLDWGEKMYVTGMLKAYREIINIIILKGISI